MKHHILVVDDCEDIRFVLKLKLSKMGFDVVEATDGEDALEILEEDEDIDIMLMDIMMPNLSGLDVLEEIRNKQKSKKIMVILLTANKEESVYEKAVQLGADGFITKPIKDQILQDQLKKILEKAA